MNSSLKLFRLFGITIQLHYSWWFVFALLSWSLATSFFPEMATGYSTAVYWLMGMVSALFLFVSVLLHELSHSLVALTQKIKVENITLFFFGGVAGIPSEEMKPKSEFLMAIAGPLFSLLLAGIFYLVHSLTINPILAAMSKYLSQLNLMLGLFNAIPGFPLDGGRAFRALLYLHYKDIVKATKIAVLGGRIFAGCLVFLGIIGLVSGDGNSLWFIFLGGFLYFIAGVSYEQILVTSSLNGVPVHQLISPDITTISASMKFDDFQHRYAQTRKDIFIVTGKSFQGLFYLGLLPGLIPLKKKNLIMRDVAIPISPRMVVSAHEDAASAFQKIQSSGIDFLPAAEKGKIIGIVTRKDLFNLLLWRLNVIPHNSWKQFKH